MKFFFFGKIPVDVALYLGFAIPVATLSLWLLLALLNNLLNKQVDEQVEKFAIEAKIPKVFRDRIRINIKWR